MAYITDKAASIVSHANLGTSTFTIQNGNPIKVLGIFIGSGFSAATGDIEIRNGSAVIHHFTMGSRGHFIITIAFIADAGLSVVLTNPGAVTGSDIDVTVFHEHE